MSLLTNLISYWKLDEASGNRADSVGSNTLVDTNTVLAGTGKINNAADFEAANTEYFTLADNASISIGNIDFTFSMWVNMESGGFRTLINKEIASGEREFVLWYDTTGAVATNRLFWRVSDGLGAHSGDVVADTIGALSTGTWYFIVVWHDATADTVNIQVNNGAVDSASYTFGGADTAGAFWMGNQVAAATRLWDGMIDEVGFWKRTLTATERQNLYNSGNGLAYPLIESTGNFLAFM